MTGPARIAVEIDRGRARLTRLDHGEFVAARLLSTDGPRVRVALLASCATLLAGDRVEVAIDVGAGVQLELVEPAGTVAYNARGGRASWEADITLADRATLHWRSAPFVVADGAHVDRSVTLHLAAEAQALTRDLLVLGRSRESGGAVRSRCRVDIDGDPLLVEDLDLTDLGFRTRPGIIGSHRTVATAMLLGATQSESATTPTTLDGVELFESELAGPGALARALGRHAHAVDSALDLPWARWCRTQRTGPSC